MLISFDIDGTLALGDPPGHVTLDLVRKAKELGHLVGSASDRTIADQVQLWKGANVEVDFVSLKHRLLEVRHRFDVQRCLHIGDTETDRYFALQAGFDFLWVHEVPDDGSFEWLLD